MKGYFEDARSDHNKAVDWTKWTETVFEPTKAWMVQRHKELNDKYFGGRLTTPSLEAKRINVESGHRVYGHWYVYNKAKEYERDRKGRIIPSTVGKRKVVFELALNTMFKGDDFFWESILLHEMCHQAVYELTDYENEDNMKIILKDKTSGHHKLWEEWADRVTRDGKHVVTRFSDCKQEAMMLSYLPDTTNILIHFVAGGQDGLLACNKRYMDGVISTVMTTIFPETLEVYENKDPMFLSMKQSHRSVDYRVKDGRTKEYLEDMFIVSGTDNVFMYEFNAVKGTNALKLIGTEEDYGSPEYQWLVFEFESGQKAVCKMPPGAYQVWRNFIELDSEDDFSVMKTIINILDFGSYTPKSRSAVRINKIDAITTKGAPRTWVQLPYVKLNKVKDSYGRPITEFSLYAIQDTDEDMLISNYNGEISSKYNKDWFTKIGAKYVDRVEEQWGVLVWRNEDEKEWHGWTVRGIHQSKIMQCIMLTQNVVEGLSIKFANEKDLQYFNSYTELPQLRNYTVNMQGLDMIKMSEWAYDNVPGNTSKKNIDSALGISDIVSKEEFKSNINKNKQRYEEWAKRVKICVVWHNRANDMFFTPSLKTHKTYIAKMLGDAKADQYKAVGSTIMYGIPQSVWTDLVSITTNRTINPNYFDHPIYKLSDNDTAANRFISLCDEFELDAESEMKDSCAHWWADHIGKPYTGKTNWKDISAESLDDAVFDTLCGVPLTKEGLEFIKKNGTEIEKFNL